MGYQTSDDAGIYRLNDDIAIVTTADFITPPVNDPYLYGQIAAANAISDVYAMGGKPVCCLNLVAFPSGKLSSDVLNRIISGALYKITEAGAVLAGGHSIEDDEPKFGLAVTGIVHPEKYWANTHAQPGDVLVLTKPIGSGVLFNANLKKWVSAAAMDHCVDVISTLNKDAARVLSEFEPHAVTDVTGFGLAGHAMEIAKASGVQLTIRMDDIPVMDEALAMYRKGMLTGTNRKNEQMVKEHTRFDIALPTWHREIVFDPQTSGGLLAAVPEAQGKALVKTMHDAGIQHATLIGSVKKFNKGTHLTFE